MGCPDMEMLMRARSGTPTKYPGVKKLGTRKYEVRAKVTDPRTGKTKEVVKKLENVTAAEAARHRQELVHRLGRGAHRERKRVRVGEFAQSWAKSKALKVSRKCGRTYSDALDLHILPELGDLYYDQLTQEDVQDWVDRALLDQWTTRSGERRRYSPVTVHGWFRVLRTMTRDAVVRLRLPRDPTIRIAFPAFDDRSVSAALTSERLSSFLEAMREKYPQHYALTITLAFTGLRFGHACALRWEDWVEEDKLIRVRRKHVFGELAPISRRKQARPSSPWSPSSKRCSASIGKG
jgi:integrase